MQVYKLKVLKKLLKSSLEPRAKIIQTTVCECINLKLRTKEKSCVYKILCVYECVYKCYMCI